MINAYEFITVLKFASHCAAKKDVRYYLNGVLFRFSNNRLELVASDGHRVAFVSLTTWGCGLDGDYIVDNESVKSILTGIKAKPKTEAQVAIGREMFREIQTISVSFEGVRIEPKLIDGKFPNFDRIKPRTDPTGAARIGMNADYVARGCVALKPYTDKRRAIAVETWDANTVMRLSVLGGVESAPTVLIMPARIGGK